MFSHITQNWRGKPLVSHDMMVNLIGSTTTRKGLKIRAELDENEYQTGIKISDKEIAKVNVKTHFPQVSANFKYFFMLVVLHFSGILYLCCNCIEDMF